MEITKDDLFVQIGSGGDDLLEDWRWLIGPNAQPFLVSSLGDAFLQDANGVHWLNVGDGSYTKIAESIPAFQAMLGTPENVDEWFIPQLVGDILSTGMTRATHQCFGFKKPPVLGGEYAPSNFEATDLIVHFSILGQIHEQVKNLPEGTPIANIKIK